MFGSRKRSLTIVLTVVTLLAMLAPAAMAAPQWVHGVTITEPKGPAYAATAAYVEGDRGDTVTVKYDITIIGTQVNDAHVMFTLFESGPNHEVGQRDGPVEIEASELATGTNSFSEEIELRRHLDDGWYDIEVCVSDDDDVTWCDYQPEALLVDGEEPKVNLVVPGTDDWRGATFINGKITLVGEAWDDFGPKANALAKGEVKSAQFEYCIEGRECRWSDDWVKIADAVKTPNIPNQWQAEWDSTQVPDTERRFAMIRMCAFDYVGNTNCEFDRTDVTVAEDGIMHFNPWKDMHWVFVNNRFEIDLLPGWNLISLPMKPNDPNIETVLFHLIQHKSVLMVATCGVGAACTTANWKSWVPGAAGNTLLTMVDGQGYWILMAAAEELTEVGTWNGMGPSGPVMPPSYPVFAGWNLIGYTQWGRPTVFDPKDAEEYLGPSVAPNAQALWRYDAAHRIFKAVEVGDEEDMTLGAGYWLALTAAGTIAP